jgi:hypothetical protein
VPLGPLDREAFNVALDHLQPKGKRRSPRRSGTPPFSWVPRQPKATVILITDS